MSSSSRFINVNKSGSEPDAGRVGLRDSGEFGNFNAAFRAISASAGKKINYSHVYSPSSV